MPKTTQVAGLLAVSAMTLAPVAALAGTMTSEVEFDFSIAGQSTVFSQAFAPDAPISFTENYGGYTLLINGTSQDDTSPYLSFTVQVQNTGNTVLPPVTIGATLAGLPTGGAANFDVNSQATAIFFTKSSATYQSYLDPNDALFGMTEPLSSFALTRGHNAFDDTEMAEAGGLYSLSDFFTLSPSKHDHTTLEAQLDSSSIPEPAPLAVMTSGLLAAGLLRRRRRR